MDSSCRQRAPTVTDEGVIIHESDPTTIGDGLGLVWGSVLWPSGISLAKYITSQQDTGCITRKRILELGCGTGVVGLTMAKLGARHVLLTDSESALWPVLRRSIASNSISQDKISIHALDWRDPSTFLLEKQHEFDLVVAADILYSGMDKLFARALASHLPSADEIRHTSSSSPPQIEAIIACPFRKDSPLADFFTASMRLGLAFDRLEDSNGNAVGAFAGVDAKQAFQQSRFVPLDSMEKRQEVSTKPTFSCYNQKMVQIFRVRRIHGTAQQAASIRRVNRI